MSDVASCLLVSAPAPRLSAVEKQFLSLLLRGNAKEWTKKSPRAICESQPLSMPPVDLSGIQLTLAERESEIPHTARAGVSPVVPAPQDASMTPEACQKVVESLMSGESAPMTRSLRPSCILPVPPLYLDEEDLVWLNPPVIHTNTIHTHSMEKRSQPAAEKQQQQQENHAAKQNLFMYDRSMCEVNANVNEAKRLMAKGFKAALSLTQQQQLKSELEKDPSLVYQIGK